MMKRCKSHTYCSNIQEIWVITFDNNCLCFIMSYFIWSHFRLDCTNLYTYSKGFSKLLYLNILFLLVSCEYPALLVSFDIKVLNDFTRLFSLILMSECHWFQKNLYCRLVELPYSERQLQYSIMNITDTRCFTYYLIVHVFVNVSLFSGCRKWEHDTHFRHEN